MLDVLDIMARECFRSFAVLPNARLIEEHGVFGVVTDVPLTFCNGIATARDPEIPAVLDIFRERRRAFRWWVRDGLGPRLVDHGMRHMWDSAGMTADLGLMRDEPLPRDLSIVRVRDDAAMTEWAHVLTTVFERPPSVARLWCDVFGTLGYDGAWAHFVGYTDGAAVATATVLVSNDVACIYHVATLAEARGRGYGSAVTRAAMQYAREHGAREAALQSSSLGVSVYRGLGFTERCMLSMYEWEP